MHWRIRLTPINEAMARDWPEATRMNLLDDSPSSDMAAGGRKLDTAMHERFQRLSQYALDCGSDAVLFTCSAFGPCIEEVARRLHRRFHVGARKQWVARCGSVCGHEGVHRRACEIGGTGTSELRRVDQRAVAGAGRHSGVSSVGKRRRVGNVRAIAGRVAAGGGSADAAAFDLGRCSDHLRQPDRTPADSPRLTPTG